MVSRHSQAGTRPRTGREDENRPAAGDRTGGQIQLVGRRIRRLRKDRRLTVADLAAAAGLQAADVARLEKGEYRVSLDVLFRLLGVLATSVEEFFADIARELAAVADPGGVREL